jgi:hypothetical protein
MMGCVAISPSWRLFLPTSVGVASIRRTTARWLRSGSPHQFRLTGCHGLRAGFAGQGLQRALPELDVPAAAAASSPSMLRRPRRNVRPARSPGCLVVA